jgi:hypothetical protein
MRFLRGGTSVLILSSSDRAGMGHVHAFRASFEIRQRVSEPPSWTDDVSLVFQKIEILDVPTGTLASDALGQ